MGLPATKHKMTLEEFLAWEAGQPERWEFFDGEAFMMAGGSDVHNVVTGNMYMALRIGLQNTRCNVFMSDVRLRLAASDDLFYPDVFVTCAESDRAHSHYKAAPSLVVEVLSHTTSAYDRGANFAANRKLPSLREYVLIDTERLSIDLFRRDYGGHWVLCPSEAGDTVEFARVGLSVPMERLYEDVSVSVGAVVVPGPTV